MLGKRRVVVGDGDADEDWEEEGEEEDGEKKDVATRRRFRLGRARQPFEHPEKFLRLEILPRTRYPAPGVRTLAPDTRTPRFERGWSEARREREREENGRKKVRSTRKKKKDRGGEREAVEEVGRKKGGRRLIGSEKRQWYGAVVIYVDRLRASP